MKITSVSVEIFERYLNGETIESLSRQFHKTEHHTLFQCHFVAKRLLWFFTVYNQAECSDYLAIEATFDHARRTVDEMKTRKRFWINLLHTQVKLEKKPGKKYTTTIDQYITILGLNSLLSKTLIKAGIMTVSDLINSCEAEIQALSRIGPSNMEEIKNALASFGYELGKERFKPDEIVGKACIFTNDNFQMLYSSRIVKTQTDVTQAKGFEEVMARVAQSSKELTRNFTFSEKEKEAPANELGKKNTLLF